MDPWFEDPMSSKNMYKLYIGDKDERSAHAKMSTESLNDPKMEEQKLQSMIAPVFPSRKKQDVSNLASRKINSINTPPIKYYLQKRVRLSNMNTI